MIDNETTAWTHQRPDDRKHPSIHFNDVDVTNYM